MVPGQGLVKFCNNLGFMSGMPAELEMVIGSLRLKAKTGECSPPSFAACTGLASGTYTAQLLLQGGLIASRSVTIAAGGEHPFVADRDQANMTLVLADGKLSAGGKCANFGFVPIPPTDGGPPADAKPPSDAGPPPGSRAKVKFCSEVMRGQTPTNLDLVIGTTKLTAVTSRCNSAPGEACVDVPTGRVRLSLQEAGMEITSVMADLQPNVEYTVSAELDQALRMPKLTFAPVPSGRMCSTFVPPRSMSADAGTRD